MKGVALTRNMRRIPRGVATLAVTMLLLFGTTIVAFYLNRGLLFEQKTAANQLRSTSAFEAAEAGLEWATGMLNRPSDITTNCTLLNTTNISFRKKYVQSAWNAASSPTSSVVVANPIQPVGCYLDVANNANPVCSCQDVATTATNTLLNPVSPMPAFTVSFAPVAGDDLSVEVTSIGCNAVTGACTAAAAAATAAATAGSSDATATVRAILKFKRILRAAPAAALTCGGSCNPAANGNFNVSNFDSSVNGVTVNSGTTANVQYTGPGAIGTIPGIPPQNSIIAGDLSLQDIRNSDPTCTNDKMFGAYFGSTIAEFQNAPATVTVTNKTDFEAKYGDGYRSFYFPSGANLQGGWSIPTVGTQNDPVTIVVNGGDLRINSTINVYGLIFSDNASAGAIGTGSSVINGALVTCNDFSSNGNGAITYDGKALTNVQLTTASMVRVPGSWRDR